MAILEEIELARLRAEQAGFTNFEAALRRVSELIRADQAQAETHATGCKEHERFYQKGCKTKKLNVAKRSVETKCTGSDLSKF